MARPRKPTKLKELNGSAAHDPQRINKSEPKPTAPLGDAPDYFAKEEVKAWGDIVSAVVDGVAFESDRIHVEATAKLLAFIRTPIVDDEGKVRPPNVSAYAQLTSMLAKLGMNPADRSKIVVEKEETEDDPWDNL